MMHYLGALSEHLVSLLRELSLAIFQNVNSVVALQSITMLLITHN